jgi:predicted ATPase
MDLSKEAGAVHSIRADDAGGSRAGAASDRDGDDDGPAKTARVVQLVGEAGIGKTALAEQAAALVAGQG